MQAIALQKRLFEAANSPDVKPALLSGLVRAWCDVNEERRKLRMQPLPRSVDVSKLAKRGRVKVQASEPQEPVKTVTNSVTNQADSQ